MKNEFNKYGKRLTERECEIKTIALYTGRAPMPSKAEEQQLRKAEFNLKIDCKLGEDFPQDKRELIHAARERATKKFLWNPSTLVKAFVGTMKMKLKMVRGVPDFDEGSLDLGMKILAEEFTKEKNLATEDIIQFFGEEVALYVKKLRPPKP